MSAAIYYAPIARTVRGVALALQVLSGPDGIDPYSLPAQLPQFNDFTTNLPL